MLTVVVIAAALPVLFALGGAVAKPSGCTKDGGPDRDILTGGRGHDVLCGRGGNDYLAGDNGRDDLNGGTGDDTMVAGDGSDIAVGHGGSDRVFTIDDRHGNDTARGGPGIDSCFIDRGDRAIGCERISRVSSSAAVDATLQAYSGSFFGLAQLGELFQDQAPPPPPPGTVTITVTVTAAPPPLPECTSPPAYPPAPCPTP